MVTTGVEVRQMDNGRFLASYPLLGIEVEHLRECFAIRQANEARVRILRQLLREAEEDLREGGPVTLIEALSLPMDEETEERDEQQDKDAQSRVKFQETMARTQGYASYFEYQMATEKPAARTRGRKPAQPSQGDAEPQLRTSSIESFNSSALCVEGELRLPLPQSSNYTISESGAILSLGRDKHLTIRKIGRRSYLANLSIGGAPLVLGVPEVLTQLFGQEACERFLERAEKILTAKKEDSLN